MIPPPAPAPPMGGARMLNTMDISSASKTVAFVTAAREAFVMSRREAQGVG